MISPYQSSVIANPVRPHAERTVTMLLESTAGWRVSAVGSLEYSSTSGAPKSSLSWAAMPATLSTVAVEVPLVCTLTAVTRALIAWLRPTVIPGNTVMMSLSDTDRMSPLTAVTVM